MSEYNFDLMINRIKLLKKEKKITNVMLAELSGIPIGTLNKILGSETKEPSVNAIIKIANALNVSADYLIYGEEAKSSLARPDDCFVIDGKKIYYKDLSEEAQREFETFIRLLKKAHNL